MASTGLRRFSDGIREFFLLEEAQKRSATFAPKQLESMKTYYQAATRRLQGARDLRSPSQTPAALTLYRQGTLFLALAFLFSTDKEMSDGTLSPEATFERLDAALSRAQIPPPPDFAPAKALVLSADMLELDRLPPDEAARKAEELDAASQWLAKLVDVRSTRDLKAQRIFRLAAGAIVAVLCLLWIGVKLFSPKNYALDRPATASSVLFSTTPAGVNDGNKTERFGFHSADDESPWWAVDLGKNIHIREVRVLGRGDCCFDQSIPLALEVSDDGATYRKVAERTEQFSSANPWIVKPTGASGRFVRLRTERRSPLVLTEVEVYGR